MGTRRDFLRTSVGAMVGARYAAPEADELQQKSTAASTNGLQASSEPAAEVTQANLVAADALLKDFMISERVSAGQLAVCRDGRLLRSTCYATKPPAGYSAVTTGTLFRIASCSKMFTCAAITALQSRGDLDLDTKVFPLLGIQSPAMSKDRPDQHVNEISVRHLVDHGGGWNNHETVVAKDGTRVPGTEWDPMFSARLIALEMRLNRPPTRLEMAQYMYGQKLQFLPGSQDFSSTHGNSYSNFGYMLLGLVVEKVSGKSYLDFIHTGLDSGCDTSKVDESKLLDGTKNPREVWYVSSGSQPTQLNPRSSDLAPTAYGGSFIPELHDGAGGLMTNAETLARFSSHYAVWGLGRRAPNSDRSGSLPGTSSFTYCRPNGVDCGLVMNTREFDGGAKKLPEFSASLRVLLDKM